MVCIGVDMRVCGRLGVVWCCLTGVSGMWIALLWVCGQLSKSCGVRDGHSYVEGFGEDDVTVMLQYLCSA